MFNQGELAFDPWLITRDLEGDTILGALGDLADPGASRVRQQRRDEILTGEGDRIAAVVTRHAEARVQGKAGGCRWRSRRRTGHCRRHWNN